MTNKKPNNLAASVRQRLMNIRKETGEDFQYLLTRYGLERLLYRLSKSPYRKQFILKGAVLFQLWTGEPHRPTRDLDLLGVGEPSTERFQKMFAEICQVDVEADGLDFQPDTVQATQIKEEDEYQGIRITLEAKLEKAKIPLQIDIGFGDAITPSAIDIAYPALLEFPSASLKAYPRETVVAEKFQAMVVLGIANSRMKDFFDIWTLALRFDFDGSTVAQAIQATFARRMTPLPSGMPLALTPEFSNDRYKQLQWTAFITRSKLHDANAVLSDVVSVLDAFLMPPTNSLIAKNPFSKAWSAGGPWTDR